MVTRRLLSALPRDNRRGGVETQAALYCPPHHFIDSSSAQHAHRGMGSPPVAPGPRAVKTTRVARSTRLGRRQQGSTT